LWVMSAAVAVDIVGRSGGAVFWVGISKRGARKTEKRKDTL
jgi:hypothetical protein